MTAEKEADKPDQHQGSKKKGKGIPQNLTLNEYQTGELLALGYSLWKIQRMRPYEIKQILMREQRKKSAQKTKKPPRETSEEIAEKTQKEKEVLEEIEKLKQKEVELENLIDDLEKQYTELEQQIKSLPDEDEKQDAQEKPKVEEKEEISTQEILDSKQLKEEVNRIFENQLNLKEKGGTIKKLSITPLDNKFLVSVEIGTAWGTIKINGELQNKNNFITLPDDSLKIKIPFLVSLKVKEKEIRNNLPKLSEEIKKYFEEKYNKKIDMIEIKNGKLNINF